MKNSVRIAAVAAITIGAATFAPAQAGPALTGIGTFAPASPATVGAGLIEKVGYRHRRRWRRGIGIGAGILTLGLLGAAIASNKSHAHGHRYYDGRQCRRWRRWCNKGNRRSCWKFDTRC